MTEIARKLVDGLMLVLIVVIALMAGVGLGTLLIWEGQIPQGTLIMSIIVFGSLLGVTSISCYCLRLWTREQQHA